MTRRCSARARGLAPGPRLHLSPGIRHTRGTYSLLVSSFFGPPSYADRPRVRNAVRSRSTSPVRAGLTKGSAKAGPAVTPACSPSPPTYLWLCPLASPPNILLTLNCSTIHISYCFLPTLLHVGVARNCCHVARCSACKESRGASSHGRPMRLMSRPC